MVTISAYFGFLLSDKKHTPQLFIVLFAVMIHSFGTSMLNQYQEIEFDKKMERTKNRPLAKSMFNPKSALYLGIILILLSFIIPLTINKKFIFLMLLDNFIIYNCIYTPLKKKTSFALLIGSICGAIPPVIGWLVGNDYLSLKILLVATAFYMWQVPHFLFLTEKYKNEYKKAGFRILINETSAKKYNIILTTWLISYFLVLANTAIIILGQGILSDILISLETILILMLVIQNNNPAQKFRIINISIMVLIIFYIIKTIAL
ncbi:UbiA family prenyltransferase [Deferribacteraceae bacterium V6Fe1]|nr:UbiA family prenyltransferase [Deferribacteraceae bacterium V6Fe1]